MTKRFAFKVFLSAAVLGSLLLASPAQMKAGDREEACRRRIHNAEERLHQAERRHGEHSRQAEQRRHQLEQVRESCHGDRR